MKSLFMGRDTNALAVLLSSILLLIAILAGGIAYRSEENSLYVLAALLAITGLLVPSCLIIANQW